MVGFCFSARFILKARGVYAEDQVNFNRDPPKIPTMKAMNSDAKLECKADRRTAVANSKESVTRRTLASKQCLR